MANPAFGEFISLGLIRDLELLAENNNCVLWIRDHTYNIQLYVSSTYNTLYEQDCLSLYNNPDTWNKLIDFPNSKQFSNELKNNRTLINPNYTATYCIKNKNRTRKWFLDRSFHFISGTESNRIIAGCALPCANKRIIETSQATLSETLDLIITKYYKILATSNICSEMIQTTTNSELLNSLSEREKDIFKLVIQGQTMTQIANEMYLSPRTIEDYLIKLKNKLNCSSKSEIIMKAIENRWLLVVI